MPPPFPFDISFAAARAQQEVCGMPLPPRRAPQTQRCHQTVFRLHPVRQPQSFQTRGAARKQDVLKCTHGRGVLTPLRFAQQQREGWRIGKRARHAFKLRQFTTRPCAVAMATTRAASESDIFNARKTRDAHMQSFKPRPSAARRALFLSGQSKAQVRLSK